MNEIGWIAVLLVFIGVVLSALSTYVITNYFHRKRWNERENAIISRINDLKSEIREYVFDAECLALISGMVLGGDKKISRMISDEDRPGVRAALRQALYRNAWVECGPGDGMRMLEEKLAKKERGHLGR